MPDWMTFVIGAAALAVALGTLWQKVLRPGAKLISTTEEMLPLLKELTVEFRDSPGALKVLSKIAAEFRTDSGSSLRDLANRLERAAEDNRRAVEWLTQKMAVGQSSLDRAERSNVRHEVITSDVADDLAESHRRADNVQGAPGEAADAAMQQTAKEKEL